MFLSSSPLLTIPQRAHFRGQAFRRCVAALLLLILSAACATRRVPLSGEEALQRTLPEREGMQTRAFDVDGVEIIILFDEMDAESSVTVEAAMRQAVDAVSRWGEFDAPVVLTVHPSHEALEEAVNRRNYPWLRAWARYDTIELQSPRTWSVFERNEGRLQELLVHELTHCLMFQLSATPETWQRKGIPLWFLEGMASVTARQGYRRAKDVDLWRYLVRNPGKDPVLRPESIYQHESEIVYAAAHRAFEFLLERYSENRVRQVMKLMKTEGIRFPDAFVQAVGIAPEAFANDFLRYLRWEGWRKSGEGLFQVYSPEEPFLKTFATP